MLTTCAGRITGRVTKTSIAQSVFPAPNRYPGNQIPVTRRYDDNALTARRHDAAQWHKQLDDTWRWHNGTRRHDRTSRCGGTTVRHSMCRHDGTIAAQRRHNNSMTTAHRRRHAAAQRRHSDGTTTQLRRRPAKSPHASAGYPKRPVCTVDACGPYLGEIKRLFRLLANPHQFDVPPIQSSGNQTAHTTRVDDGTTKRHNSGPQHKSPHMITRRPCCCRHPGCSTGL